ncbi:hypothetical protein KSP39_PZI003587 [Platanthera zijinensis]|uniref:Uncharacterized protein n=1 Tax=Platanthera zijinensis TaxID=2320716 RepID=A0AAP0GD61_9ASPA
MSGGGSRRGLAKIEQVGREAYGWNRKLNRGALLPREREIVGCGKDSRQIMEENKSGCCGRSPSVISISQMLLREEPFAPKCRQQRRMLLEYKFV